MQMDICNSRSAKVDSLLSGVVERILRVAMIYGETACSTNYTVGVSYFSFLGPLSCFEVFLCVCAKALSIRMYVRSQFHPKILARFNAREKIGAKDDAFNVFLWFDFQKTSNLFKTVSAIDIQIFIERFAP